jgi:SAM-dependent methyltransferase
MSKEDLYSSACNPQQYDSPDLDWLSVGQEGSPSGLFFSSTLRKHLDDLTGNSILEIGSGTGRLFSLLQEKGASSIQGVEPSEKSSAASRKAHPEVAVFAGTFSDFQCENEFHIVLAIMVFEHLPDLPATFRKIRQLLKSGGNFYLVVGDYECQTREETYAKFERVELGDGVSVVATKRPFGVLHNIVRPLQNYCYAGEQAGLTLVKKIALPPTEQLLEKSPSYVAFKNKPICHLLIFQNKS